MSGNIDAKFVERLQRLPSLSWISDAPLFIDRDLVERFFDAVVRPAYEHEGLTEGSQTEVSAKLKATMEASAKGEVKGLGWIPDWLFPLKAELSVGGSAGGEGQLGRTTSRVSQFKPIWNAERQLEELTRHYFQFHGHRLVLDRRPIDDDGLSEDWSFLQADTEFFAEMPRALAFIDLPAGTKIIPTAAEFENGTISLLYEDLVGRLTAENGGPQRKYPEGDFSDGDILRQKAAYWASFEKYYSSKQAMLVIEEASQQNGRIRWIDFRLPIGNSGETLHLHVVPAGGYDAGVFGYNFVRRAFKHGVRLVGSLKSEPDLNVMAIYDK